MYKQTHDKLHLCQLTAEQRERTCGYWYTVETRSTSLTAFRSEAALMLWLNESGLKLTAPLVSIGQFSHQPIDGKYEVISYMEREAFDAIVPLFETRKCSNARYTLAKVTETDGVRAVHHLNCNLSRIEYDYQESNDIYSGEWIR